MKINWKQPNTTVLGSLTSFLLRDVVPCPSRMKYLHFPTCSQSSLGSSITETRPGPREGLNHEGSCFSASLAPPCKRTVAWFWSYRKINSSSQKDKTVFSLLVLNSFDLSRVQREWMWIFFSFFLFCSGSAETAFVGIVLWAQHLALWSLDDLSRTGGPSDWLASLETPTLPHWLGHMELYVSRTAALATLTPTVCVLSVAPRQDVVLKHCSKLCCSSSLRNNYKLGRQSTPQFEESTYFFVAWSSTQSLYFLAFCCHNFIHVLQLLHSH